VEGRRSHKVIGLCRVHGQQTRKGKRLRSVEERAWREVNEEWSTRLSIVIGSHSNNLKNKVIKMWVGPSTRQVFLLSGTWHSRHFTVLLFKKGNHMVICIRDFSYFSISLNFLSISKIFPVSPNIPPFCLKMSFLQVIYLTSTSKKELYHVHLNF